MLLLLSSLYILFRLIKEKISIAIAQIWDRFKYIVSLKIPYFQLKNSSINTMQAKSASHKYHNIFLNFIYIDNMYKEENTKKKTIEYTIGRGKTGTLYGTGVKGWLYIISIQYIVSFQ